MTIGIFFCRHLHCYGGWCDIQEVLVFHGGTASLTFSRSIHTRISYINIYICNIQTDGSKATIGMFVYFDYNTSNTNGQHFRTYHK